VSHFHLTVNRDQGISQYLIRIRESKKNRQHNGQKKKGQEEFEDTKGVNRISNLKKDIQHNGQKKQGNTDLQSITHKTKDRVTIKGFHTKYRYLNVSHFHLTVNRDQGISQYRVLTTIQL
jgi:hypothetical protein